MTRIKNAFIAAGLLAGLATITAPAAAEQTTAECNLTFKSCEQGCLDSHPDELLLRAKCITVCSGSYAACDSKVAYQAAKEGASKAYEKTKGVAKDAKDYIDKKTE